ncbi:MAG: hypothetical protein LW834_08450 [Cyanobium sp. 49614_E6]|nr:hypothetical protein [Cyanobium sp. 49614_E6]
MAEFKPNTPIETSDPTIEVTVSGTDPLPIGPVRFQLVVFDEQNNPSQPAFLEVTVRDTQNPTAVLDGPREGVELGKSFSLSGERSSDVEPGKIVRYEWTMVPILERPAFDTIRPPIRPLNPLRPPIEPQ